MGILTNPSGGLSEVLAALHNNGRSILFGRLCVAVSRTFKGDNNGLGADPEFEGEVVTVLGELQTAGYVVGKSKSGQTVDLTGGTPPYSTVISLTPSGRGAARHPSPRPVRDPHRSG